eukprot:4315216-Amphidinium_carterae.1
MAIRGQHLGALGKGCSLGVRSFRVRCLFDGRSDVFGRLVFRVVSRAVVRGVRKGRQTAGDLGVSRAILRVLGKGCLSHGLGILRGLGCIDLASDKGRLAVRGLSQRVSCCPSLAGRFEGSGLVVVLFRAQGVSYKGVSRALIRVVGKGSPREEVGSLVLRVVARAVR